jgi:hypothetical protein
MIIAANQIYGVSTRCVDGPLGQVDDLLFDDRSWQVMHLVVRFGGWLTRRRVLVTPTDVGGADWPAGQLKLSLAMSDLRAAPSLETHPPVAVQKARELELIAWDGYWSGVLGRMSNEDPNLRSTTAVKGHRVWGLDAQKAGYVDNFVIDDVAWTIRYLVVRTGFWRNTKRVVLEPRWVDSIAWEDHGVRIHLPTGEIEHGREFLATDFTPPR